ncbi:MAG: hypothetical protein GX305_00685, partial [Aminobacterium colombiense]|nr:hypothetical protein [Aminobacterium colombiense]
SKLWADIPEVDDIPDESLGLFPLGSALCVVELYDIVPFEEKHFKAALFDELPNPAGYAWLLRNVRPVKAFNVRGMPGLFEVEDNLIKYL